MYSHMDISIEGYIRLGEYNQLRKSDVHINVGNGSGKDVSHCILPVTKKYPSLTKIY